MTTLRQELKRLQRIADGKQKAEDWEREIAVKRIYGLNSPDAKGKEYFTISEEDMRREQRRWFWRMLCDPKFYKQVLLYIWRAIVRRIRRFLGLSVNIDTFTVPSFLHNRKGKDGV